MKSEITANRKVLSLQKKLFRFLKAEVDQLLGKSPLDIRHYEKEIRSDFKRADFRHPLTKQSFIEKVVKADVIFIADFHVLSHAQKAALRIMKESVLLQEAHWALGLEMIPSHLQRVLDLYQTDQIKTEEFLKEIDYEEEWGFPWANYAPIFEWAKKEKIRLIALDRPKILFKPPNAEELHERDRWAAGQIVEAFGKSLSGPGQKKKPLKMFVLYGELHVGSPHLPRQLEKLSRSFLGRPLKWLSIHQNDDQLFWKLTQKQMLDSPILKLKKNVYCVFSGTPWAKLQAWLHWTEGSDPELLGSDLEIENEDFLSMIQTYASTLSQFLGVPTPSFETLNIVTIDKADSIHSLGKKEGFNRDEVRLMRFYLNYHFRFLTPRNPIAYLASPSHNGAAEIAAIHLLRMHVKTHSSPFILKKPEDFYRLALECAFGFFGSLVLNPRRKCDLPKDHLKRIQALQAGEPSYFPSELEARAFTVDFLRASLRSHTDEVHSTLESSLSNRKLWNALSWSTRFTGRIIGRNLHLGVLAGKVEMDTLHQILLSPIKNSEKANKAKSYHSEVHFRIQFENLLRTIPPISFGLSKDDHL